MGKQLPPKAVVHHVNGDPADNRKDNLVVCENQSYHLLLEVRTRAYRACGNPNLRHCAICKEWDNPSPVNMRTIRSANYFVHRECHRRKNREYMARKRAAK